MRILIQPDIPAPPISAEETWEAQSDLNKLLQRKTRRQRDPIYPYNDKYGFGPCLNHIAGFNKALGIPGILPHGILPYGKTSEKAKAPEQELISNIPCIFASNIRCKEAFQNAGKSFIFPIGLSSIYAYASIKAHNSIISRKNEGSIFFRSHSTQAFTDSVDDAEVIQWLLALPKCYHPIRISVFPFDWNQGLYKAYADAGFQLISAGHAYDTAFIWRHLLLIQQHRYVLSTGMGTHIFHAIMCGKPALIIPIRHNYFAHRRSFKDHLEAKEKFQGLSKCFQKQHEQPTRKQIQLSRTWLGQDLILPAQELKKKLEYARMIYNIYQHNLPTSPELQKVRNLEVTKTSSQQEKENHITQKGRVTPLTKTSPYPNSSDTPNVSICTITHNRRDHLSRLQACIEQQTYPLHKIEWLVLDDSTAYQESLSISSETPITIKYQRLRNKLTLGAKRNLSHKLCSGEIIVYMDDDDFYFPERVRHAVNTLSSSKASIAGCTYLHIYFTDDNQLWLSGPFSKKHATAGTFAMTKEFARHHFYDNNASCNEEKSFLANYSIPLQQLDPLQTMICISHSTNTFDKRRMRQKGATRRMRPLPPGQSNPLKQKLWAAGFKFQPRKPSIKINRANSAHMRSALPPIALVCGPWGSGTSALCAVLNALGVHAEGPFFQTNDPLTPACFEMLAFNKLVNRLVDESTLECKHPSNVIKQQLLEFRDQHFTIQPNKCSAIQLLKTPACSALLPELQNIFSLRLLVCLRDFEAIEHSRQRRGWPEHLGQVGAERIYHQLLNFISSSDAPALFVRHRDLIKPEPLSNLIINLSDFLALKPTLQQRQLAIKVVTR